MSQIIFQGIPKVAKMSWLTWMTMLYGVVVSTQKGKRKAK